MADSYTTDNRNQRIISSSSQTADYATYGTFANLVFTHNLGYVPMYKWFTTYTDGTVIIGAPYGDPRPTDVYVVSTATSSAITFFVENYVGSGDVTVTCVIFTEVGQE